MDELTAQAARPQGPRMDNFHEWQQACINSEPGGFLAELDAWNSYCDWCREKHRLAHRLSRRKWSDCVGANGAAQWRCRMTDPGWRGPAGWLNLELAT